MVTAEEQSRGDITANQNEHKRVKDIVRVTLERTNKVAVEYSQAHSANNERKSKVDAWRRRITEYATISITHTNLSTKQSSSQLMNE